MVIWDQSPTTLPPPGREWHERWLSRASRSVTILSRGRIARHYVAERAAAPLRWNRISWAAVKAPIMEMRTTWVRSRSLPGQPD